MEFLTWHYSCGIKYYPDRKKTFLFIILSLAAFLTVFSFNPKSVLADGMIIKPDPYSDRWDYSSENSQQAFINYENGLQKMIISVGFEEENSNGVVWLFPVPSDPNEVTIDVVKSLPQLSGEDISKKAKSNLKQITKFLQMTQIYTYPLVMFTGTNSLDLSYSKSTNAPGGFGELGIEQDIEVYGHLEKEGITSEIITAKTADGLYDYFKSKNLKIENGSIPILGKYIGKKFSFIASWITQNIIILSPEEVEIRLKNYFDNPNFYPRLGNIIIMLDEKFPDFKNAGKTEKDPYYANWKERYEFLEANLLIKGQLIQEIMKDYSVLEPKKIDEAFIQKSAMQKGIFVTFPTKDIYFPLLPTSVYEGKVVPATIRLIGHVSPYVFQNIKSYTRTGYYLDTNVSFADDLKNFYGGSNQNIKYTKIEINAKSSLLTDDLWIKNQAPLKTYYSTFVAKHLVISVIILLILSSVITGILVGLVFFKESRNKIVKLGLIGLSNCLSILGLLITTVLVSTKNKNEKAELLLTEIKQRGYFWKRRIATILFFLTMPFLIFGLLALPSLIRELSYTSLRYFMSDFMIPFLIIYVLPILALTVILVIKRIKIEDRNLFEQLKSAGYSSWSFQPKDKMKIAFVPIYSISFLLVSWLLVKLVGFTV